MVEYNENFLSQLLVLFIRKCPQTKPNDVSWWENLIALIVGGVYYFEQVWGYTIYVWWLLQSHYWSLLVRIIFFLLRKTDCNLFDDKIGYQEIVLNTTQIS